MSEEDRPHEILLAVIDAEEYMLELEATVAVGRWGGQATAYTAPSELLYFTRVELAHLQKSES